MYWLCVLTLFVGSALLFLVQPLVARLVLPQLGGTPAVWNTCMVFFQAALLAGYAYAHAAPSWLGLRRHALLHLGLMLLALAVLTFEPLRRALPSATSNPGGWLLGLLALTVGLPFLVVAAGAPLLQRWFAASGHTAASDPYFLYAASNFGSMLGLLVYPFVLEPRLTLAAQGYLWWVGYLLLIGLTGASAVACLRGARPESAVDAIPPAPPLTAQRRLRWLLLAFVPSSLLLSVTTYLTTDLAAVPLLWVVPLALYLLTFILAFARRPPLPHALLVRWMPLVVVILVLVLLSEATEPVWLLILLHLVGLFWLALVCHGELADSRPPASRLTEFYLWLSLGGVLGGVFNALLAPLMFNTVLEYPLGLVLACLLRPGEQNNKERAFDLVIPAGLLGGTALLVLIGQSLGVEPGPLSIGFMFGLPLAVCYTLQARPLRFGLGVAAVLVGGVLYHGVHGRVLYRERSFFGMHRVTLDPTKSFRLLIHGDTIHGQQSLDPGRRRQPLTYYHRTGPIGQVFAALDGDTRLDRVGLIGLGVGALACYGKQGQQWTYYEIDPAVVRIARNPELFSFLTDCEADLSIVLGDARMTLQQGDERYGLLVVDAFSSDAIPVHLLTREALAVYRRRLTDGGLLAFNISNRYLDLQPVLAALARDARLECLVQDDLVISPEERTEGKAPSHWVVMGPPGSLAALERTGRWQRLRVPRDRAVWTDDYSNVWSVFKWE